MSGTIGLVATDLGRYTIFTKCLVYMQAPVNTHIQWCVGTDFANNRNTLAQEALDRGSEWLLYLDDDHAFPPDHLMRLLSHDSRSSPRSTRRALRPSSRSPTTGSARRKAGSRSNWSGAAKRN